MITLLPLFNGEKLIQLGEHKWSKLEPACLSHQSERAVTHSVVNSDLFSAKLNENWSPEVDLSSLAAYPLVSSVWPSLALLSSLHGHAEIKNISGDTVIPLMATLQDAQPKSDGWSERDRFILDSLRLGLYEHVSKIPIESEHFSWLCAFAAAVESDFDAALTHLKDCPNYQRPETTAIHCAAAQARNSFNSTESIGKIESSPEPIRVLAGVFGSAPVERKTLYEGAKQIISWIPSIPRSGLTLDIKIASKGNLVLQKSIASSSPYTNALLGSSRKKGLVDSTSQEGLASLKCAPLAAIDNLIDCHDISDELLSQLVSQRPDDADYIYLRVRPELATFEAIKEYEHSEEVARRELLESNHEDNEMVGVMQKLKSGEPVSNNDILLLPEPWRSVADRLSNYFVDSSHPLDNDLASDITISKTVLGYLERNGLELPKSSKLSECVSLHLLSQALTELLSANWESCVASSLEILRTTNIENQRDEALNLLACAYWQMGEDERAIGALRNALEDEYNESLQVNIGIVASSLKPEIAVKHLSQLAREAPSTELQVEACLRGYQIWKKSTGSNDRIEDKASDIPTDLKLVTRSLMAEAYSSSLVSNDKCWSLLCILADNDSEWLNTFKWPDVPMPGRREMKNVALAKAKGIIAYIKSAAILSGNESEWCRDQRNTIIELVLHVQNVSQASKASGLLGMTLLETGIELPPETEIKVACFTVLGVLKTLEEEGGGPSERITKIYFDARKKLQLLEPASRADQEKLVNITTNVLLRNLLLNRENAIGVIAHELDKLNASLSNVPRYRIRKQELREAMKPMAEFCKNTEADIFRLREICDDKDLRNLASIVIGTAQSLQSEIIRLGI